jgi:hypothetical protein
MFAPWRRSSLPAFEPGRRSVVADDTHLAGRVEELLDLLIRSRSTSGREDGATGTRELFERHAASC